MLFSIRLASREGIVSLGVTQCVCVHRASTAVAVLPGWHGVAEATPKKPRATPQATPNENMNFGT